MAELPAPTTRSPGKLKLIYTAGALVHEVGTNFNETVDVTDVATIRTEAEALAAVVGPAMPNTCVITSWKITDPTGVTLYEENFTSPITGSKGGLGDDTQSDSSSMALTGKGQPEVGLKQGQTKFTIFPNYYNPNTWNVARQPITVFGPMGAIRDFLNTSTVTGADFYGSPASWRAYVDLQINAHYQKRYGI